MKLLRKRWPDLGGVLAIITLLYLVIDLKTLSLIQTILWISFVSLLLHQLEEYRFPGNFPINFNKKFFNSTIPDRYPLNSKSVLIINVYFGWITYLLAALFAEKAIWLAIASFITSIGNIVIHTFVLNIKGRTLYNPGIVTALILFLPITIWFFFIVQSLNVAGPWDYILGILLGIVLNYFGIVKVADFFKDKHTTFILREIS